MDLALIGPSGAGKGTHISRLKQEYGFVHISTGDLLRENLDKTTALGLLAKKYMAQGELVPDEVVGAMIDEKLRKSPNDQGLLFDGFPRTIHQAKFIDGLLKEIGRGLDVVIYLKVSDEEVVKRLVGRLICRECLAPFHRSLRPFQSCPQQKCAGEHLYQRSDDTVETVRIRLRVFNRVAGPLLSYYQQARRLVILEAEGGSEAVGENLIQAIKTVQSGQGRFASVYDLSRIQRRDEFTPHLQPKPAERRALDLVLLGGPGCGKGTQAENLGKHFHLRHVATGDLFREHLKSQTDLGKLAKAYMDQGELVPDDITDAMVCERLSQPDTTDGFILDGYPRTLRQAEALNETLASLQRKLVGVISIQVSDEEIINRLSGRLICRQCQTPYHLRFKPPVKSGLCDLCQGQLYQREDDNPDTVRTRLKTFHAQTEPLIDYYRQADLIVEVNGEGNVPEVTQQTIAAVKKLTQPMKFKQLHRRK
ncbi:MAG: adenylate kinase [Verrucomicrobia bacterium]|nr:adenylate kinase [Verrucomicrobiota bacterium]